MIHTKLLIRRLAYVPWLLAAGLVLGWAGEAQAQITLTLKQNEVREDAGETPIKVTAKSASKVAADTYVTLSIGGATDSPAHTQLNKRYRILLPTVKIPKDKDTSEEATITFIPNNDKMRGTDYVNNGPGTWTVAFSTTTGAPTAAPDPTNQNDDLWIEIDGDAGGTTVVTSTYLWMRDDDKLSTMLTLSPDPSSLSKDAGFTDVTVTATLNGSMSKNAESFPLVFDPDFDRDGDGTLEPGFGTGADSVLTRDAHYGASTASLRIAKRKSKGEATISIDPKGTVGWIAVAGNTGNTNATTGKDTLYLEGIDLNSDGDTGDSFTAGTNGLTEAILGLDIDVSGGDLGTTSLSETNLGIDLNANGTLETDAIAEDTVLKEGSLRFGVVIETDVIAVTTAALANVKSDGLTVDRDRIREDMGTQTLKLKVTLDKAAKKKEEVRFTISEVHEDPTDTTTPKLGERDRDYIVSVQDLEIGVGESSGEADLTVIPDNNPGVTGDRQFQVSATVGGATSHKTITIVDVNTLTSSITLSAKPGEVGENADADSSGVAVTITATLAGKTFDKDTQIRLALRVSGDGKGTAIRDKNYTARIYSVMIDSGMVSGSRDITIYPVANSIDADKTIVVMAADELKNEDEEVITISDATIKLKNADPTPAAPTPEENKPSFSEADIAASDTIIEGEVGRLGLSMTELPAAMDGDAPLEYRVSTDLPAGLMFDAATRTISGTPTTAGESEIFYTVVDKNNDSAVLTYTIEIAPEPEKKIMVASVSATQTTVRENDGATDIEITATLAEDAPVKGTIWFTLQPSEAVRDVDYRASIGGTVVVEAGDTQATTTLTLDPINNDENDGNKDLTVQAAANGSSSTVNITIADDEEASTAISLSADPNTISENAGTTAVTITATLNGKALDAPVLVTVSIASGSATRDEDYSATFEGNNPQLTIAKDDISGSVVLNITPVSDGKDEGGSETIMLNGAIAGLDDGSGSIILEDAAEMMMADPLAFAEGAMIDDIEVTVGADVSTDALPEAMGGDGDITYSVSGLPAGLDFDAATRMISGSPTEEGTSEVTYMAMAGEGDDAETVELSFSVTVNPPLVLDLSSLFGAAAGKANPAHDPDAEVELQPLAVTGVAGQSYTLNLPALPEGTSYQVSGLPAGLSFDGSTTISGTPAEAGQTPVTIAAVDSNGAVVQQIEGLLVVEPAPEVVIPTFEEIGVVGQAYSLQLPGLPDGVSYSVSGLPADLMFDAAMSMISGVPAAAGSSVVSIEAPGYQPIMARLVVRNLDAPGDVMAQDYPNDNSGFILLSWELSEDHAVIDGYRIFRALPALDGELVPWAMVDAVPGQEHGYAIVATVDLIASKWGVAAEQGGISTEIVTTKAAFVRADDVNQPYALMAETLMASKEAAQAGDAPVFATLLPEALAFAQGVVPNLKSVEGGLLSAITMTEEAVRPIDNIAPLAVPSLSVLDAPNDTGNRIALTWALSPSDGVLQEVVAGATGPATVEPVAGVHGYAIYRRAAVGEEEFVMVGQVEAGATEFVDETALNGVRYIYEVRAFDVDNETSSDTETAIAVRNNVPGLFGSDNSVGFDDFFLFADHFGLTADDPEYDPAFDLDLNREINQDDYNLFVAAFGNSTDVAGKRVPMLAGLNADARMYLAARTAMPSVGEEFVLDVSLADFMAVKGYGLQMQYDASKLEFVEARTEQPLGGSELAAPQVLADEAGVLTVASYGDVVSEGELALSLVFRPTAEIEDTAIEITDSQTYDSEFGFNRLALPAPVQVQTRPEVFALANNFPNPFNPATTIKYALPQAADVHLTVYNVVGQVVRTLVAEHQNAGRYVVEWDATNDSGHSLSSGMYFYRLEAGGEFREVKKMLLLK